MKLTDSLLNLAVSLDTSNLPKGDLTSVKIQAILNIVFVIMGAIAVLIVVLAGFRYIISRGEPQEVTKAKNAILYALIGLAVVILAFSIVNFVVLGLT